MNAEKKIPASSDSELIRIALLDRSIENINETMKDIKSELKDIRSDIKDIRQDMNGKFEDIRKDMKSDYIRLDHKMDANFIRLEHKMDSQFKWVLGTIFALSSFTLTGLIGLGTLMAHGFHWF